MHLDENSAEFVHNAPSAAFYAKRRGIFSFVKTGRDPCTDFEDLICDKAISSSS